MLSRIVVTGGGTGGHVFTGIAILDEVRRRNPSARTDFIGSAIGQEQRLVPASRHSLHAIGARPLRLNGLGGALQGLASIPRAILSAARILERLEPEIVVGVGGPASGPVLVAAKALGLSTCLHEQNTVPGLANRWAGAFVSNILAGLPQTRGRFAGRSDVTVTGNPVRGALLEALQRRPAIVRNTGGANDPLVVLVLGGSGGSRFLNAHLPEVLARAARAANVAIRVIHQSGAGGGARRLRAEYARVGLGAEVMTFIDDIAAAYHAADLAVALAGAGTLAELALAGLPSVIVPLADAADDHQRDNARHFAREGGVCLMDEAQWSAPAVSARLAELLGDHPTRAALGARFRALASPRAALDIVDHLERVVAWRRAAEAPKLLQWRVIRFRA